MEKIEITGTGQSRKGGFSIPVDNMGAVLVVNVPFEMPINPGKLVPHKDMVGTTVRMQNLMFGAGDPNLAGIVGHLLGNLSNDCKQSLDILGIFTPEDYLDQTYKGQIDDVRQIYAKKLVGYRCAYEIAKSIFIDKEPDYSLKKLMNFARYDAFVKCSEIAMDMTVNGQSIDDFDGDFRVETSLLVNMFELIHNSAKAVSQKDSESGYLIQDKRIAVNISIYEGNLTFMVDDNGPGINAENISKVFETGFSTRPAAERAEGRGGLGLSYLQPFVKARRGNVFVQSIPLGQDSGVKCETLEGKPERAFRTPDFEGVNTRFMLYVPDSAQFTPTQRT